MSKTVAEKSARRAPTDRYEGASLYAADGGRKYLNHAERQRVLAAIESLDPDKALFALTLAWTGARVSEVLALTPASFQVEAGLVAFTTLKRRRFCVREVPIPGSLMEAIDAHFALSAAQRSSGERDDAANVGDNLTDGPLGPPARLWPWHRVTVWRLVKDLMRRARISGRQACPRGLRHGFGVGTLQAGVPLNLVQRWLGHARISTTAIYANASGPEEQLFARRFWATATMSK